VVALVALAALVRWPAYVQDRAAASDPLAAVTPAPLRDDASIRSEAIALRERQLGGDPGDQITPRILADDYLQRYRERGEIGDVLRAEAMARRSLRLQPRGNVAGLRALAGAQLTLHRFRDALAAIRLARRSMPADPGLATFEASLDLELGDLVAARGLLARFGGGATPETEPLAARLDELTGHLAEGRRLLGRAARRADARYDLPAERRAWFHVRLGEMAFAAGAVDEALREEETALARFPGDAQAWTDLARFHAALGAWSRAEEAARRAVTLVPSPENLGLLADALDVRGDLLGAAATRDLILAVERLGNTQHIVDRLLALEEADHGVRLEDAYRIARRELAVRDDPYSEDTLAWCAARSGRWDVARKAIADAMRWGTEDARLWYHAGVIAEHDGATATARRDYERALALNPHFQAGLADDARTRLAALSRS
jgi:tetratricopeptide (TPR) repeat protein